MSLESVESRTDLAAALSEIGTLKKDHTANTGKFSYNYIGLNTVLDAVKPALAKHNFMVIEPCGLGSVTTLLIHIPTGDMLQSMVALPGGVTAQELGSAITYARRYSLCALLSLEVEEDDDGARASSRPASSNSGSGSPPAPTSSNQEAVTRLEATLRTEFGGGSWAYETDVNKKPTPESERKLAVLKLIFGTQYMLDIKALPEADFQKMCTKANVESAIELIKSKTQEASSAVGGGPAVESPDGVF